MNDGDRMIIQDIPDVGDYDDGGGGVGDASAFSCTLLHRQYMCNTLKHIMDYSLSSYTLCIIMLVTLF